MNKFFISLFISLILISLTMAQLPEQCEKHMQMMEQSPMTGHECACKKSGMMMKKIKIVKHDDLELTPEQQKQVDEIEYKTALTVAKFRADLDVSRIDLRYELRRHQPNENKVKSLIKKIGEFETNIKLAEMTKQMSIMKILTPEQRQMMKPFSCCPGIK